MYSRKCSHTLLSVNTDKLFQLQKPSVFVLSAVVCLRRVLVLIMVAYPSADVRPNFQQVGGWRPKSNMLCCRSGASVTSSQGSPGSNAAEAPQLDDYMGRHASSSRTASAGTALSPKHQYSGAQEPASAELSHQRLGLWVGESNPSRQSSIDRAKSPPRRQRSESSGLGSSPQRQKSGILRTGSSGSSLRGQEDHSAHAHKSPTRGPSRLRDSSTDAEVHYAAVGRKQSPVRESSTEEEACPHSRVHMPRSVARESSAEEEEERVGHRHSPRDRHGLRQAAVKVTQVQPQHQHYHTAEKYLSRAGVREALSPRRQPSHTHGYAAKARTLDLQDNCTLADEEQDQVHSRGSPRQHHARDSGQGGAQVSVSTHTAFTAFAHKVVMHSISVNILRNCIMQDTVACSQTHTVASPCCE